MITIRVLGLGGDTSARAAFSDGRWTDFVSRASRVSSDSSSIVEIFSFVSPVGRAVSLLLASVISRKCVSGCSTVLSALDRLKGVAEGSDLTRTLRPLLLGVAAKDASRALRFGGAFGGSLFSFDDFEETGMGRPCSCASVSSNESSLPCSSDSEDSTTRARLFFLTLRRGVPTGSLLVFPAWLASSSVSAVSRRDRDVAAIGVLLMRVLPRFATLPRGCGGRLCWHANQFCPPF